MPEPTVCAVGGQEITGPVWDVPVAAHPEPVAMCEAHARIVRFGTALGDLLGHDNPIVVRVHTLLDDLLNLDGCPTPVEEPSCRCGLPAHGVCAMAGLLDPELA